MLLADARTCVTYMLMVEVDINVKLVEGAPSASTAVASRRVLADVCGVFRWHTYSLRLISISSVSFSGGGGDGGAGGGGGVGERALTTPAKQLAPNLYLAGAHNLPWSMCLWWVMIS